LRMFVSVLASENFLSKSFLFTHSTIKHSPYCLNQHDCRRTL
jgi:hypothetical protein